MNDQLASFRVTDFGDGVLHYERADGYVIDFFAIPPVGGPCAVLVAPSGDVIDYFNNPIEAAAAAPQWAVAS